MSMVRLGVYIGFGDWVKDGLTGRLEITTGSKETSLSLLL